MCGRRSDSTTLPDDPGAFDDRFGYRVTEEGFKALAEYEKRHGKSALRKVTLTNTVAEALRDGAWRDRQQQRRKEAGERGNRLLTVCGRWRGGEKIPELRLMGLWLQRAGFHLGQHCEVEVGAGTLTIRAI